MESDVLKSELAGTWYTADRRELAHEIDAYLDAVDSEPVDDVIALLLPHAGYRYSGQVAAHGMKQLAGRSYSRVMVLGPSHCVALDGAVSLPEVSHIETPLGKIEIDRETVSRLWKNPEFVSIPQAHAAEHSVQIELPFLQQVLGEFKLIPIVCGALDEVAARKVALVLLENMDAETLVVISSDFTHYGHAFGYVPFQGDLPRQLENLDLGAFEQIAKKIMSCEDIIEPIVEAQVAKKAAADKRAATLAQKKLRRVKVQKHVAATGKNATLFLCEGDSAMGFLLKVRDTKTVGGFPLRGVVMNVFEKKPADVLKNKELSELIAVLNLDINDPDSVDNMDYATIATLADADHDGNHISGLLLSFFYKYWPRLFSEGRIVVTRTPMMISTKGAKTEWFYNYDKARDHKNNTSGWYHRYIKGLASLTELEYDSIINKPMFDRIVIDNPLWFEVMFGPDSSPRKEWIKDQTPTMIGK